MPSPDASIVIVHHRGLEHLLEALDGVDAASREGPSLEVVLVDNASETPLDEITRRHPAVRTIPARRNLGFAGGCRLGVESAAAPVVLFVNDDAVLAPDAPARLVAALSTADPDVAAVGGRLTDHAGERNDFSDGFLTFDGHAFAEHVGLPLAALPDAQPGEERLFACGGLMAVRRQDFLTSGGFDEDYFAYLEDVDFGWRQWIQGRRIVAEPRATARHRGGATAEALGVFSRGFLFEKNAFATAYKNLDREHFRDLMPAVLMAFLTRVAAMLSTRNAGAAELRRDPYRPPSPEAGFMRRLFGIAEDVEARVGVDDPLTVAQLRALVWIHSHHVALAEKRRRVQASRRRPDSEIFARFPLRIVPTYPGDEQFGTDFFAPFLEAAPPLVRSTLDEIFERGA
ncbi:MAG TPA: glycosyltransferase family 2 protein [Thermoanaerobaculia bacterium]|nr:glycosyltransferase family 2 protein [Thermoanaerobaculia bacterium]